MFTRIHWRIAATYTALIALVLLGLGVYLVGYLQAQLLDRLDAELLREARLVGEAAQYRLAMQGAGGLDPLAKRLGADAGVRVTLIAADGTVLGDSDEDPAAMENHATRPEVKQALETGTGRSRRYSTTLRRDLLYHAVVLPAEGARAGVARVALPLREVEEVVRPVVLAVVGALGAAALLAVPLSVLLARVTARRVQALTRAARRLSGGDLSRAVPVEGRDEVGLLARAFNDMAGRLRVHVGALEVERGQLAAVLTYMADGVLIAGGDGVVRLLNPAAARLLGTTPGRARGRSVMVVVRHHELAAAVQEALAGVATEPRPRLLELGPLGRRRAIRAVASRIPAADAGPPRALLVLQDVTEIQQAERVRREFVANTSHELRTPVAGLKALVETLEEGAMEDREAAREFLARMRIEVDGLASLVEELLELSRLESGQLPLQLVPIDLGAVVGEAAERLRPLAERQGVAFEVRLPGDLLAVRADPERLRQIVVNLVHNAVKFTPPGGRVSVTAEQREGEIAVVVSDSGVGIAPEALPRVFERFYMGDRARGGGTGLGLAIAKHLVQAHGGRIWAESPGEGRGSTFTFALPSSANL